VVFSGGGKSLRLKLKLKLRKAVSKELGFGTVLNTKGLYLPAFRKILFVVPVFQSML
jgi:hypothetical protein